MSKGTGIPALDAAMQREAAYKLYIFDLNARLEQEAEAGNEAKVNSLCAEINRYESVVQDIRLAIRDTDWKTTMPAESYYALIEREIAEAEAEDNHEESTGGYFDEGDENDRYYM